MTIKFISREDLNTKRNGNISIFDFDEDGALLRVTYDHKVGSLRGIRNDGTGARDVSTDECEEKVGVFIAQSL